WSKTPRVLENEFVGPSTQKSLAALGDGVPLDQIPRSGRSVGAAMRVAPLAISFPDPAQLTEQVVASCEVSHFTRNAISGAMAMAYALGESIQPTANPQTVAKAAQEGAVVGRGYGEWSWAPPIEQRIEHVLSWVDNCQEDEFLSLMYELIGVDLYPDQLVPCAIGLAVFSHGDPMRAMLLAANLGGDTDTLASMVGSICGGLSGAGSFDKKLLTQVEKTNEIDLRKIAQDLLMVRRGRDQQHE
ncbi:MAG: ADP-ribosylglycohydrolase family protein, partial [Anaerolineales bacterium]|nr:ADP-ribosylglycohydrolase family protein [Anaerolineales bacterium]